MSKLIQRDCMTFKVSAKVSAEVSAKVSALARGVFLLLGFGALAGCASSPHHQRYSGLHSQTTNNFFPQRIYGAASPRVVADGEEAPSGGGRYQVGKPYRIAGKTYVPSEKPVVQTGMASWYGSDFHGRRTANGEVFDLDAVSAAHPTMPLPSYARVTNLGNARSIVVRVNDRGPYHGGRVMDVSQRVAEALDFHAAGTAHVKVEWVGRADLAGGDSRQLMATLRDDGAPAQLEGFEAPSATVTAEQEEPAPAPRKTAKATKTIAPDDGMTRLAARSDTLDSSMTAYAPVQRRAEAASEIIVAPTPAGEIPANSLAKPTPLDQPEMANVDATPVSTVRP